ncbi:ribosomal protein S18 acetylase RimI-like enzyme [Streptococcus loxodontisalivarius]|uniref:Ribosomal protein S18 acetylase RimI-like enzyme n=1 Tax=Streptococcus loxodontisalivarius TaxID=1349415 RepID=A0ABS2PTR5_9STRE|nr:ribosomal protein S18 acetylase RimI-like enzyme [Streptococcus loxodontisalivarius]
MDNGLRGRGLSSKLLQKIFEVAKNQGYKQVYLETAAELAAAISVYEYFGFKHLQAPIDNGAGHNAMDIWMLKEL